jgi:bifunctional DNA-binding transcriptional regulator/antitoxin component of YhaV-PrlF toxin-antitoxin module
MGTAIHVRQRGTLTLPLELRQKYDIKSGDTFQLIDVDGIFVLTPMVPMVPELTREIALLREEAGVSMDDLLQSLREMRSEYVVSAENDA